MVVGRRDSREVDTCTNEQESGAEEDGATLEDERGRRVGGMKEVGSYKGEDIDPRVEESDADTEDVDVDADG